MEDVTKVTVYSNLPEVELFVNGVSIGKKESADHFFYFEVENKGETTIEAVSGEYRDCSTIRKVEEMNQDYILKEKGAVLNWFDVETREGRFCLNDKMGDILGTLRGKLWFVGVGLKIKKAMSAGKKKGEKKSKKAAGFEITGDMMQMLNGFTVLRLTSLLGMVNLSFDKETAGTLTSVSLIFLSVTASALGIYDKLAKHAGAGTLVPITGFANAVVSPAIDSHAEGLVLGTGAKIFTVAGPVILYGILAGGVWGVVAWVLSVF